MAPLASLGSQVVDFFTSFGHRAGLVRTAGIAVAAVVCLGYAVLWLVSRHRRSNLATLLGPYRLTPGTPGGATGPSPVLTMPLLTRAATRLQAPLTGTRFGRWLDGMLERAGSRLRVGELMTIWATGGVILLLLGWLLAGLVGLLVVLVLVLVVPVAALQGFVDHRAQLFASQLPDVLKLTASSLRAGFSLVQGLDSVAKQVREPSRSELQRVLVEARLGRPVDEALEAAAGRIANRDFTESVVAVQIQQETGGNLAALFDTLAETMTQRLQMRREIRSLTAEGRISAYILGAMPLLLGIFIFFVNRAYEMTLFHSLAGKVMVVGGLLLQVIGFYWMYKTVKIEV